ERAGRELFQRVLAALDEARAHRGRGTEEGEQQPGVPPEIADEREVALARAGEARERPGGIGEREVVVQAGDHLHAPAVAGRAPRRAARAGSPSRSRASAL